MQTVQADIEIKVVAGFEVDMTVRSHPIPGKVLERLQEYLKEKRTIRAASKELNIHRSRIGPLLDSKSCAPATLVKILEELYKTPAA